MARDGLASERSKAWKRNNRAKVKKTESDDADLRLKHMEKEAQSKALRRQKQKRAKATVPPPTLIVPAATYFWANIYSPNQSMPFGNFPMYPHQSTSSTTFPILSDVPIQGLFFQHPTNQVKWMQQPNP